MHLCFPKDGVILLDVEAAFGPPPSEAALYAPVQPKERPVEPVQCLYCGKTYKNIRAAQSHELKLWCRPRKYRKIGWA